MKLADSHCHINDSKFDEDREEVFKRAENELEFIVNIGNDIPTSEESVAYSKKILLFMLLWEYTPLIFPHILMKQKKK